MMREMSWSVLVFLSVIVTIGCNSSAKHVQIEELAQDAEIMAMREAPPAHPLGRERPILPPEHSQFAVHPDANIEFRVPIETFNPNTKSRVLRVRPRRNTDHKSKILIVRPDPNVDYKIAAATPEPGIDYKMLVVPDQGQIPHAIGKLEVPPTPVIPHVPGGPPIPRRPNFQRRDNAK